MTSVDPGSGAAEAGLREGDLLLRVDHRGVASSWESHRRLRFFDRGDEVDVVVLRDGVRLERRLRLDESGRRAWKAVEDDWRRQPDVRRIRASDRDRRIVIHWDEEELGEDLERLAERLDEMGEEIGRRVERAMEDVDWEVHSRHGDRRHHVEIEWDDGDVHLDRLGEIVEDSVAASLAASLHALEHVRFDVDIDLDDLERDLEHLEDELEREAERLERRFERRHRRHR